MTVISRHTLRHAPVGLWQFDGNLNDSSGNGFTLTVESGGGVVYADISPGVRGVYLDGVDDILIHNAYAAALNILGDLTIECLITLSAYPTASRYICSHGADGETYSTNFAYEWGFITGTPRNIRLLWESGAGVNSIHNAAYSVALGQVNHFAVTRIANVAQFYLNGKPLGAPSTTLTPAAGGESARFRVGDGNASTFAPNCILSSLKVIAKGLSAAEIKAEYMATLGPRFSSAAPLNNFDVVCEDTITINDAVLIPIQYHDTTHTPLGLWQLNGTLADSSGFGRTLTVEAGTERYTEVIPGVTGFLFDGSSMLIYNVADVGLQLTGNATFEALIFMHSSPAAVAIVTHGAAGDTQAANFLYNLNTSSSYSLVSFSESGAGVDASYTNTTYSMPYYTLCHFAWTRTSNVIQFYLNGQPFGAASSALTTPDGGTSGRFRLGGAEAAPTFAGVMVSAKLIGSALSSAQVLAEYNRTLGRFYDSLMVLT